jgi:hypothetical protein
MNARLTAYGAAKIANEAFGAAGLPTIPPQMMYNYTTARIAKGKSPFIEYSDEAGVDREDLKRWIDARIAKAGKQVADPEQAAFDESEAH